MHKIFCQCCTGIRSDILQRRRIRRGRRNDDRIVVRFLLFQCIDQLGDCRCLLSDCHINTDDTLSLLIQNRIHRNRRFTGLTVADDQLTLSTADRKHGINRQNSGLQRNSDGFTLHDTRRLLLDRAIPGRCDLSFPVNGSSQRINDSSKKGISNRKPCLFARTHCSGTLADTGISSKQNTAYLISADILYHTAHAIVKNNDFAVHCVIQPVDIGNSVADVADNAYLLLLRLEIKILDLAFQDGDDPLQALSLRSLCLLDALLYLLDSSFIRPVIFLSVNGKYKAAA